MTNAKENPATEATIIGLEKAALERWNHGDPTGFLELSAPDVVYFDPFLERRLNGLDELTALYKPITGQVHVDRYEMLNPLVQATGKMAVLTFNLNSYEKETVQKWNCTEVYRLEADGKWRIIQTHWSLTKPELKISLM
jgi:ketosteroid isomerase-like protein